MASFDVRVHEGPAGDLAYRLFEPPAWKEPRRLLVMLHGCTQDSGDLAVGTGMNGLAEEAGFAVLYPEQSAAAHTQRCWTWYDRAQQRADGSEVTRLTSLVRGVTAALNVDPDHTYLAGISAGGAMANILAVVHPEMFAGLAVHSGIPFGAAEDVTEGLTTMQHGGAPGPIAAEGPAFDAARRARTPARVIVLHGGADSVVRPVNGQQVAAQWAAILDGRERRAGSAGLAEVQEEDRLEGGRAGKVRVWRDRVGDERVYLGEIEGLGHAWSGGSPEGTYTDPVGPSASRLIATFLGLLPS